MKVQCLQRWHCIESTTVKKTREQLENVFVSLIHALNKLEMNYKE